MRARTFVVNTNNLVVNTNNLVVNTNNLFVFLSSSACARACARVLVVACARVCARACARVLVLFYRAFFSVFATKISSERLLVVFIVSCSEQKKRGGGL